MGLSDYIKSVSLITHFNEEGEIINDLLKICRNNIVYKKYGSSGDELLSWSINKVDEYKIEKFFNSLSMFPEKNKITNDGCKFRLEIVYNDNSIEDVFRLGDFLDNGFYDWAKLIIDLIPTGYSYSKLLKVPLIKIEKVCDLNFDTLELINPECVRAIFIDDRNGCTELFVEENNGNYIKYLANFSEDSKPTGDDVMKHIFIEYKENDFWNKFVGSIHYRVGKFSTGKWHSIYLGCDIFVYLDSCFMSEYGYDILSDEAGKSMMKWVDVAGKRE